MRSSADGGDSATDYDKVAGEPPTRSGKRRFVTSDDARTAYTSDEPGSFDDELAGVNLTAQRSGFNGDTIARASLEPHDPKRPRSAAHIDWLMRTALDESEGYDLHADGEVSDPLLGYEAETTEDYRAADPENPRGDGGYIRDRTDSPLTRQIAELVTRGNGRIPRGFSAHVQNEGYARSRDWTVYAPAPNPYHVAAAVMDLLQEADDVGNVDIHVADETAAEIEQHLRSTMFGYALDDEEMVERALRELRWASGLSQGRCRALEVNPSQAREQLVQKGFVGFPDDGDKTEKRASKLRQLPGDAWDYHKVTIHIHEEAEQPYYG